MGHPIPPFDDRRDKVRDLSFGLRALMSESERMAQNFAGDNGMSGSDFRALLQVVVSDSEGRPLAATDLRKRLNVSAGAVTYIIDRLVRAGHVRRESDASDRRKVMLRYSEAGFALAQAYFRPIGEHYRSALADVSDHDLDIAERVLRTLYEAMRSLPRPADAASSPTGPAA